MTVDPIQTYGEARLPRYTSYPTAPRFEADIGADVHAEWLARLPAGEPVSLYLHVPFCRSMCWYCGCHTTITLEDAPIRDYLAMLEAEIDLVTAAAGHSLPVGAIHFGGGTPTIVQPHEFSRLIAHLRRSTAVSDRAEIAVEIDPRRLSSEMCRALGSAGVTRASLGVQSFDPVVQTAINRLQSPEQTRAAVEGLRRAGVGGLNFDLIYGLPHQTVASAVETARLAAAMRPERFAVFGYAHVPSFKKHQRLIDEAALPDAATRHAQAEAIAETLEAAGYRRIGLDHFALPDDALAIAAATGRLRRNFQGYTTDPHQTLIGLGASAIGRTAEGYVQNHVPIGRHAQAIASGRLATAKGYRLTAEDKLRAAVIERLMCDFRADLGRLAAAHGFPLDTLVGDNRMLDEAIADGIVTSRDGVVEVASDRRFLVRVAAACFDAHLGETGRSHAKVA